MPPSTKEKTNRQPKAVMFLIDAGDPVLIERFIAMGELPNFKKLREGGTFAPLGSFATEHKEKKYVVSLPIIASIFTGKTPEEHGMTSHVFLDNGPEYYYPFRDLRVKSIWNIVNEFDMKAGVVGTMGNMPVETDVDGYVASQEYIIKKILLPHVSFWRRLIATFLFPDKKLLYPNAIQRSVDAALPGDGETRQQFTAFGLQDDFPARTKQILRERWQQSIRKNKKQVALRMAIEFSKSPLAAFFTFAVDLGISRVARALYKAERPTLAVEYHHGIDFFSMLYNTTEYQNLPPRHNPLVAYYKFIDERLGEIFADTDPDTTIMVLSDHGVAHAVSIQNFSTLIRLHNAVGIFYLYGPNIKHGHKMSGVDVFDATPTMLHILGLPVGKDMKGKVAEDAFTDEWRRAHPVTIIDSHEGRARSRE